MSVRRQSLFAALSTAGILLVIVLFSMVGPSRVEAVPTFTIAVNSLADNTTADAFLTLREAILLTNGGTGGDGTRTGLGRALTPGEAARVTGGIVGAAPLSATIGFTFFSGDQTITLNATGTLSPNESLPPILTSDNVIDGSTTGGRITIDAVTSPVSSDIFRVGIFPGPPNVAVTGTVISNINLVKARRRAVNLIQASNTTVSNCTITGVQVNSALGGYGVIVNGADNRVNGNNTITNCVISGNAGDAIGLNGAKDVLISNNKIGTNAAGTAANPNNGAGIGVFRATTNARILGNLISGNNFQGIYLDAKAFSTEAVSRTVIQGNKIGTDIGGALPIPNGTSFQQFGGIVLDTRVVESLIGGTAPGEANIIAFNGSQGVGITTTTSFGNRISGNSIFRNGTVTQPIGIDLLDDRLPTLGVSGGITGPNRLSMRPTISNARGAGSFLEATGLASPNAVVELFIADPDSTGFGSGKVYCGSTTATAAGTFASSGLVSCVASGAATATSTLPDGSTSEFGNNLTIDGITPFISTLVPPSTPAASGAFSLTVNGTNFLPTSVVEWNGSARATTYVSPTRLIATILAGDIAAEGNAGVRVQNPGAGGGTSNIVNFTVGPPIPTVTPTTTPTVMPTATPTQPPATATPTATSGPPPTRRTFVPAAPLNSAG
ncbi:MAG: right-handed parallel beta-helix repeat-containing protein [Dehalococcoidia bacterium]